ncbi:hypothetical protein LBMAG18_08800 [Alphaproteobacteria bacterium]|nr:hypothetical protein LBMAG18_08800 [Alphaproteobacteria bacterium]
MKNYFYRFIAIVSIFLINFNSLAITIEDQIDDPKQEQFAREIFLEIRCLVCQGQVIESSDSEFAINVRKFIRDKVKQGLNKEQIKKLLIKDYGDEILMTPSIINEPLLWFLPLIFFILSLFIIFKKYHKKLT